MLGKRYPYAPAGKIAASLFGVAGFIVGWLLSFRALGGVPAWFNAVLWAAIAGLTAFTVFASQGPPRPPSVIQAALADGVVAGIIASVSAALLSTLIGHGAGTATSSVSASNFFGAVGGGTFGGTLGGGALGWLTFLIGGRERLSRVPPPAARRSHSSRRSRQKRKRT